MVMVSARSCEVTVGGKPYATIEFAGEYNSDQRLVWASDQRLGARVVDGPSFICFAPRRTASRTQWGGGEEQTK